jgi:Protein of unknown function (DUF3553)
MLHGTVPVLYQDAAVSMPPISRKFDAAMPEQPGNALLSPGDFVRHPGRPDWGLGQIQSMIGARITVNFENAGKQLIDGTVIELRPAELPRP